MFNEEICFHKKYVFKLCQSVIFFCIKFYIMFVLFSNIFGLIFCQINTKIWLDHFGHVKCVKFSNSVFSDLYPDIKFLDQQNHSFHIHTINRIV